MKTQKLFLIVTLLSVSGLVKAQDVILKKDSSTIISKVTKISSTEIEYKKWSNLDGPTYIISISEVASINFQNGEVEYYSTKPGTQTPINQEPPVITQELQIVNQEVTVPTNGLMERSGKHLTLDGRILSDEEVLQLVGYDNYQTYLEAKRQMTVGRTFTAIVFTSIGATILGAIISAIDNSWTIIEGCLIADVLIIPISIPIISFKKGFGKNRLNWVAEEYNRQQYSSSMSLSPSLIKCEMPQLQNGYGLGLTFSLKF